MALAPSLARDLLSYPARNPATDFDPGPRFAPEPGTTSEAPLVSDLGGPLAPSEALAFTKDFTGEDASPLPSSRTLGGWDSGNARREGGQGAPVYSGL